MTIDSSILPFNKLLRVWFFWLIMLSQSSIVKAECSKDEFLSKENVSFEQFLEYSKFDHSADLLKTKAAKLNLKVLALENIAFVLPERYGLVYHYRYPRLEFDVKDEYLGCELLDVVDHIAPMGSIFIENISECDFCDEAKVLELGGTYSKGAKYHLMEFDAKNGQIMRFIHNKTHLIHIYDFNKQLPHFVWRFLNL